MEIAKPYLMFVGDAPNPLDGKTGRGVVDWRPDDCLAQFRLPGGNIDLGLPDMEPAQAYEAGARSLVISVAPFGGGIDAAWIPALVTAMEAGLDLVSGMHTRLASVPALADAQTRTGRRLVDLREPPAGLPIGSGKPRSGRRLLTVGTDCCVGKKYTALCIHRTLAEAGVDATFRATGQTGILIAGGGIPIDAVVSDFVSGAAELLSPDNAADHWDVIEGQGSLFHPAYAAVTLGLIHGSQPDLLVLCHDAPRQTIDGYPDYPLPPFGECIEHYLGAARLTSPDVAFAGISVNASRLDEDERREYLDRVAGETGLPCVDPIATGVGALLPAIMEFE